MNKETITDIKCLTLGYLGIFLMTFDAMNGWKYSDTFLGWLGR